MTKEEIYTFIQRQKTAIISSVGEDGYPATRALIQPVLINENDIYFATYTSSRKVKHYRANDKACVYFYEKGRNFQGVEIKGTMQVITDQHVKERFLETVFYTLLSQGRYRPRLLHFKIYRI